VEKHSKSNKITRVLDAERVAKDLSGIMSKIHDAYLRFVVSISAEGCYSGSFSACYKQVQAAQSIENKVDDVRANIKELKVCRK
jgi:hypothetical protein